MRAAIRTFSVIIPGILGWTVACSDNTGPKTGVDGLSGLTISAPISGAVAGALAFAAATPVDESLIYVSLAPGSVPSGVKAVIGNAAGQSVMADVVNGGFDPVALHASVGDAVVVDVTNPAGDVMRATRVVAPRRPPAVVRTDPPPRKRDVPLNTIIVIVFSEPIDASTVNSESIKLLRGSVLVPGTIRFADVAHLKAEFHPAAPLEPHTDYQLVLTQGIRALNGLALESAITVPFTTGLGISTAGYTVGGTVSGLAGNGLVLRVGGVDNGTGEDLGVDANGAFTFPTPFLTGLTYVVSVRTLPSNPAQLCVVANAAGYVPSTNVTDVAVHCFGADPSLTGQMLFTTTAQAPDVLLLDLDRSTITRLTSGPDWDYTPQWSPDRGRIAFARSSQSPAGDWTAGLWVMRADGSGAHQISGHSAFSHGGISFTWSPDGTKLAVFEGNAFRLVNADGSGEITVMGLVVGTHLFTSAAWSPDGSTIAFLALPPRKEDAVDDWYFQVGLMNADGSNVRYLRPASAYAGTVGYVEGEPAWSPDGTRLIFWSVEYGLTVAARNGGILYSASHGGSALYADATPDWSPDGKHLVFTMNGQLFMTLADGGGTPRQLTSVPGGASFAAWLK